jgi:peptide/nickel transport system permease protein
MSASIEQTATQPLSSAIPAEWSTRKHVGLWSDAWRRLRRSSNARVGMAIMLLFIFLGVVVPFVDPYNPRIDSDLVSRLKPPSAQHWFGTDDQGRDLFRRVMHGANISLRVGIAAVALSLVLGSAIGLIAGFFGGLTDNLAMRAMDIMLSFPATLLAIGIVATRGPGLDNTMLAIGVVNIPRYARLVRSTTLSIKEQDYVMAAHSIGVKPQRIIWRHIFPNSLSPIIVQSTLSIATAIIEAAALGFLGLGAQPPTPEWGAMLSDGYKYLTVGAWWVLLFPGLAIMLTVLGFNLLGDGLRDALDPRLRVD